MFEPHGATNQQIAPKPCNVPKMTPWARLPSVILMHRYLGGLLDPFVTLLEVHKLMSQI